MIPTEKYSHIESGFVFLLLSLFSYLIHSSHTLFNVAYTNADFQAHYVWSVQFLQALHGGDPYPRWMPLGNLGLGEPTLLFYAPLFYYATAFIGFLTSSTWEAIKIVEILTTAASGFFVWLLLKPLTNPKVALAGALLCQMAPMIYMIFHYFNGLPWGASWAGFAALLYFSLDSRYQDRLVNVPATLSIAVITLTHILSAMMVIICMSFTVFTHIKYTSNGLKIAWRPIISWFLAVVLGLGLAMVYLFPALTSMHLIASDEWLNPHPPDNAFAFSTATWFLFGIRWFAFQWIVPVVSLLSVIFASYYTSRVRQNLADNTRKILTLLLVISWASLFFSSELSYPLWKLPTPLRMIQFPHRFLYVTALTSTVANVICLWDAAVNKRTHKWFYLGITPLALAVALMIALSFKITFIDGESLQLTDAIKPYGSYGEYHVKTQGPEWRNYISNGGFARECNAQQAICQESSKGYVRTWNIRVNHTVTLRLPVLFFPAWAVIIDGKAVTAIADSATGLIQVRLPPGDHWITLNWVRLPQEHTGLWLSLATLLAMLVLSIAAGRISCISLPADRPAQAAGMDGKTR